MSDTSAARTVCIGYHKCVALGPPGCRLRVQGSCNTLLLTFFKQFCLLWFDSALPIHKFRRWIVLQQTISNLGLLLKQVKRLLVEQYQTTHTFKIGCAQNRIRISTNEENSQQTWWIQLATPWRLVFWEQGGNNAGTLLKFEKSNILWQTNMYHIADKYKERTYTSDELLEITASCFFVWTNHMLIRLLSCKHFVVI